MPYSCSTCNKTHNTGEICPEPIDDVVSHIKTAINNISKLPNSEHAILTLNNLLIEISNDLNCKNGNHSPATCYGGFYCQNCGYIFTRKEDYVKKT